MKWKIVKGCFLKHENRLVKILENRRETALVETKEGTVLEVKMSELVPILITETWLKNLNYEKRGRYWVNGNYAYSPEEQAVFALYPGSEVLHYTMRNFVTEVHDLQQIIFAHSTIGL